jgi:hypothetical protein
MAKTNNSTDNAGRIKLTTLPHAKDLKWPMLWWFTMGSIYHALPWKKTA